MSKSHLAQDSVHINVLDHLRGLAALAVCLFHFSNGNRAYLPDNDPVKLLGSCGWLGVDVFFVISGFVIPYSLFARSYRLRQAHRFLLGRLCRLEPPYFACISLVLLLNYLSNLAPGFQGESFSLDFKRMIAHVAYLNAILELGWFNPVFWTLAIEFQYYLFVAVAFPIINSKNICVRMIAILAVAALGFLEKGNSALLPHYLPLFSIGMAAFLFVVSRIGAIQFWILIVLTTATASLVTGLMPAVAGCITAMTIVKVRYAHPPKIFQPVAAVGIISYSLYLLHVPIGGRVINLASRLPDSTWLRYGGIIAAFVMSLLAAFVFHRFVELPSQALSKKVGAKK